MLKLKVSQSIWLIGGVPIIGAIVLLVLVFNTLNQNVTAQNSNLSLFSLSEQLGKVAHNFAVERGLTAGFLNTKNESDARGALEKLKQHRKVAEQVAQQVLSISSADFPGIKPAELEKVLNPIKNMLNQRAEIRQRVDNKQPDANAFTYYSALNAKALDAIQFLLLKIKDPQIATNLEAQLSLFWMKERVGQYRGLLNGVFAKGTINPLQLNMVKLYLDNEQKWLDLFQLAAPADVKQQLASSMDSSVWKNVSQIAERIAKTTEPGEIQGPENWFAMATQKIGIIQKGVITLDESITTLAEEKASHARWVLYSVVSISVVVIALIVLFMFYISRSITSRVTEIHRHLNQVSQRDLSLRFRQDSGDELGDIAQALNQHLESLSGSLSLLSDQAQNSKDSVAQIESWNRETLNKSQEQFSRVDQIATAAEEMYQTSQSIAQDIHSAAQEADSMQSEAQVGQQRITQSFDLIKKLSAEVGLGYERVSDVTNHTNEIGTILQTIEDIAEQTNLLALNAAIEAARAGEQGRGFAVVADEVRKLAKRTQDSTEEVRTMIESLVSSGNNALELMKVCNQMSDDTADVVSENQTMMEQLFRSIKTISQTVEQVATAVEEQTATTKDINQNIQYINELSQQVTDVVNQMDGSVKDSSKRATEVIDEINSYRR